MMYDLAIDHAAIVAAFPTLNESLRTQFADQAASCRHSPRIERVLMVGALCHAPGDLDSQDRRYLATSLASLKKLGAIIDPQVQFTLCNLAYGANFLDPTYQQQNPADVIVVNYVYNPCTDERQLMTQQDGPISHYKQVDPARHFIPGIWGEAAMRCRASFVCVAHFCESEIGPQAFLPHYQTAHQTAVSGSNFQRLSTLMRPGF